MRDADAATNAPHPPAHPRMRSEVRIRGVAPQFFRRRIQISSDGFVQPRLTLRVSVCDGHRPAYRH